MKMKAAIYYGPGEIKLEEIERPKASDGFQGMGIVVKIRACGICDMQDIPRYRKISHECGTGIALGHEWSGEVVEIGPKVIDVKVGDRVWGRSFVPCGKCDECLAKNYIKCKNFIMGMTGRYLNGAFAEYMLFPFVVDNPSILVKLPPDVSYRDGALIEPVRLCIGVASKVKATDVVVILGEHRIMGLGTVARLKSLGVAKVIYTDTFKVGLDKARELGADIVVDELNEDAVKVVMKETSGAGADVVMDIAGRPNSLQEAIDIIKPGRPKGGTIYLEAPWDEPFMFNPSLQRLGMSNSCITGKSGISIRSPWGTLGNGPMHARSMEYIQSGGVTADKVVTHVFPLDRIKEGFETVMHSPDAIKVLIEP